MQKRVRVFYDFQIACSQRFGGVSRYHYELISQLNDYNDCKCDFFAMFNKNYYFAKILNKTPVDSYTVSEKVIFRLNKAFTLLRLLTHKYDIIHPTWYADYFPKNHKSKIVITIHDMTQELCMQGKEHIIELKKNYIYKADHIIAISENTKNDIIRLYPDIPEDKITVVYHGTNRLPEATKPQSWSCPERYLLYVGGRDGYKNGMLLVEELHDLLNSGLSIVYAGGGEFTTEERKIISMYQVGDKVIQKDVSDSELTYLYRNAVCFIYPSSYEGFGFPLLEAFDNSCPVICNRASCFPEIAQDAALYFDEKSSLNNRVRELMSDAGLREVLINKGLNRVKDFSWEKTAQQTLKVYKDLCNE